MKKSFFILCLAVFTLTTQAEVTSVEAVIDKNPVMLDEAITLTVVAEGDAERDAFNSSALLQDFVVGRTSVSSQTQIINFDSRRTTTWTTTLFPRGEGRFVIPSFTIEGQSSQPISVEVIPVPTGTNQPVRDYYVTTSVNEPKVYLQQQLLYTVKLHLATGIERGSLQAPTMPNAEVRQIGEDRQYSDIVNGKRYQIIERHFAIIPQGSGELTIRGPVFSGEVMAANTNNRFGMFNRTKPINRTGPDIEITVLPVPEQIDYHWLPSEFVQLNDEWQQNDGFVVGEPITRTLTLTAMGLVEEQLPELDEFYPPNFKVYPDQANTATIDRNDTLVAQRVESHAVIPTQAGSFVLPEVTVPWFNVKTKTTEYATIPARTIMVSPASDTPKVPNNGDVLPVETPTTVAPEVSTPVADNSSGWLVWALASGLVFTSLGWLITVVMLRRQTPDSTETKSLMPVNNDEKALFKALISTVKQGCESDIHNGVKKWLNQGLMLKHQVTHLEDHVLTAELAPFVDQIITNKYGNDKTPLDKSAMIHALKRVRENWQQQTADNMAVGQLYPSR